MSEPLADRPKAQRRRPEPAHLWDQQTGPVVLPSERRAPLVRKTTIAIAVCILLLGVVSGALYHQFWKSASHDVTRLLPASTLAFASGARVWKNVERVLELDRWRDPAELLHRIQSTGILGANGFQNIAGIPASAARQLAENADEFQLAGVPTAQGLALMLFLRYDNPERLREAKNLVSAFLDTVDRSLGYDIQAVTQPDGMLPWREPAIPLRAVFMDPILLLSFGPEAAVQDLLQAKVSGTSQPIRGKDGFRAGQPTEEAARREGRQGFWAYFDPGALHDTLIAEPTPREDVAVQRRALFVETFRAVAARSQLRGGDDLLELVGYLGDSAAAQGLDEMFSAGTHALLGLAPADADYAVCLALGDPAQAVRATLALLKRIREASDHPSGLELLELKMAELRHRAGPEFELASLSALSGEVALFGMAAPREGDEADGGDRWILTASVRDPALVTSTMTSIVRNLLGGDYAYGTVTDGDGELMLVRPTRPDEGREVLAWRVRQARLEVAPRARLLEELDEARSTGQTWADTGLLHSVRRALPARSTALVALHPRHLRELAGGSAAALWARLADDFRPAMALTIDEDALRLVSNVGLWSALTSVLVADRREFDPLLLPALSPACREALSAFCDERPRALPCLPWQTRRQALAAAACERMKLDAAPARRGED